MCSNLKVGCVGEMDIDEMIFDCDATTVFSCDTLEQSSSFGEADDCVTVDEVTTIDILELVLLFGVIGCGCCIFGECCSERPSRGDVAGLCRLC